jgi:hypothetical protein
MRKTIASVAAIVLGAAALVGGSTAHAQEASYFQQSVPAPSRALELQVGTGYTQGFGNALPGQGMSNVAGPGIGIDLGVGYRISQRWSVGVEGQYQEFANEQNSAARGLTAGMGATYHLNPTLRGDPFVRMSGGYRMLWSVNPPGAPTTTMLGLELAKATFGYDVRVSPDVALSPLAGANLDVFVLRDTNGVTLLSPPQPAAFVFAGLAGRFDIGGSRGAPASVGSSR